ncbi:MAG: TonB-dependent receptor [Spirochaetales bacterium]|nr:TonB-dependent receptor [Spirochaetales bacterium]
MISRATLGRVPGLRPGPGFARVPSCRDKSRQDRFAPLQSVTHRLAKQFKLAPLLLLFCLPLNANDTLLITAEREEADTSPGQTTLLSAEEWERKGARTVSEAVDLSPGVTVTKTGTTLDNSSVTIRGAGGEQILVLVDGVPLNNGQGDSVNLNSLSLNGIEEIQVIRGGNSAVYGDGAFGGVINLITKKDEVPYTEGEVYAKVGSYETYTAGGSVNLPLNYLGTLTGGLSGEYRQTEGDYEYSSSTGDSVRTNSDGWADNIGGNLEWDATGDGRHILSLNSNWYEGERGTPGLMEYLTPDARLEETRFGLSGRYRYSGYAGLHADGEYAYLNQYSRYEDPDSSTDEESENASHSIRLDLSRLFARDGWEWTPLIGAQLYREELESTSLSSSNGTSLPGEAEQTGGSVYGRVAAAWKEITLTPAVRWDWWESEYVGYDSSGDNKASWSLTLAAPLPRTDKISFKGNLGTAYNSPGFDDLFWSSGSYATGNADLLPEESFNWDSGLTYRPAKGLELSLIYFESYTENLIQWLPSADGTWSPSNVAEVESRGLENSLEWLISLDETGKNMINMSGSYSWLSAQIMTDGSINKGNQLAYRPKHSGSGSAAYIRDGHSVSLSTRYIGQRYTNAANTKYLDPVLLFDAAVKISLPKDFYLSASLLNLGDEEYIDKLGYPIPGREWSLTGGYRF